MTMRGWLNLGLLALAAVLGWLVYQSLRPESGPKRLHPAAPEAVQTLLLDRPGDQDLSLRRDGAGWRLESPRPLPASELHVNMLLRFLTAPVEARYPVAAIDTAALGLDGPRPALVADGRRYQFGALEPLGQRRYLRVDDEVLLVADAVTPLVNSPWWNFIDRRLLPAGARVQAVKLSDGRRLTPASHPAVIRRWQAASASLVRPAQRRAGGTPLVVELEGGERLDYRLLTTDEPRLVRADLGLAYLVSPELLRALLGSSGP